MKVTFHQNNLQSDNVVCIHKHYIGHMRNCYYNRSINAIKCLLFTLQCSKQIGRTCFHTQLQSYLLDHICL